MFGDSDSFVPHYFSPQVKRLKSPILPRMPRISISREAYTKMWLYVDIAPEEVGWMGTAKKLDNGDYLIEKVWLLKQVVSGTEALLTNEGMRAMTKEFQSRGEEGWKDWDDMHFWGHSHVRMQTHPSGTDEDSMLMLGETGYEWYIRGIFNKKGHIEFTLFLYKEQGGLKIVDVPWTVVDPEPAPSTDNAKPEAMNAASVSTSKTTPDDTTNEGKDQAPKVNGNTAPEPKQTTPKGNEGGWGFSSYFRSSKDPRYMPDITLELRAQVESEFREKVTSRWAADLKPRSAASEIKKEEDRQPSGESPDRNGEGAASPAAIVAENKASGSKPDQEPPGYGPDLEYLLGQAPGSTDGAPTDFSIRTDHQKPGNTQTGEGLLSRIMTAVSQFFKGESTEKQPSRNKDAGNHTIADSKGHKHGDCATGGGTDSSEIVATCANCNSPLGQNRYCSKCRAWTGNHNHLLF